MNLKKIKIGETVIASKRSEGLRKLEDYLDKNIKGEWYRNGPSDIKLSDLEKKLKSIF